MRLLARIKQRIVLKITFIMGVLIFVIISLVTVNAIEFNQANRSIRGIRENYYAYSQLVDRAKESFLLMDGQSNEWVGLRGLPNNVQLAEATYGQILNAESQLDKSLQLAEHIASTSQEKEIAAKAIRDAKIYEGYFTQVQRNYTNYQTAARLLFVNNSTATDQLASDINDMKLIANQALLDNLIATAFHDRITLDIVVLMGIVVILIAVIVLVYLKRIISPIPVISNNLALISGGNLSESAFKQVTVRTEDEVYDLAYSFKVMSDNLRVLINRLRMSEERFYNIFNNSPDMIAILGMKDNTIINVNQKFLDLTGFALEEVLGSTPAELNLWTGDGTLISPLLDGLSKKREMCNIETRVLGKFGTMMTVSLSASVLNINNEICQLVIMRDITAERKMEIEIGRLDRLKLIGEMAAGIGHEIRNPMTTVRGFLQMLGQKDDCAKYKTYYDLMIDELDRGNSIITDFLALAKTSEAHFRHQNLNDILCKLLPLIQADALRSNNSVVFEPGEITDLLLDEKQIRQIVINLVRNGLESSPSGSALTIRTYTDEKEIVLAIQDNGQGIGPDVLKKIGTPFFTTKENGTGLGLAICYSIADRHNAKIVVDTGPNGTTFFIRFKQ